MASKTYFNLKKFSSPFAVIGCDYWGVNMHKAVVLEEKNTIYWHKKQFEEPAPCQTIKTTLIPPHQICPESLKHY